MEKTPPLGGVFLVRPSNRVRRLGKGGYLPGCAGIVNGVDTGGAEVGGPVTGGVVPTTALPLTEALPCTPFELPPEPELWLPDWPLDVALALALALALARWE